MATISNDHYNPFGWRIATLHDHTAGPARHQEMLDDLATIEAEEVAHGRRHLTIWHGDPTDLDAARALSAFYDTLEALAAGCAWVRVKGDAEYVTITVAGNGADEHLACFAAEADLANPGPWTITESPWPGGQIVT